MQSHAQAWFSCKTILVKHKKIRRTDEEGKKKKTEKIREKNFLEGRCGKKKPPHTTTFKNVLLNNHTVVSVKGSVVNIVVMIPQGRGAAVGIAVVLGESKRGLVVCPAVPGRQSGSSVQVGRNGGAAADLVVEFDNGLTTFADLNGRAGHYAVVAVPGGLWAGLGHLNVHFGCGDFKVIDTAVVAVAESCLDGRQRRVLERAGEWREHVLASHAATLGARDRRHSCCNWHKRLAAATAGRAAERYGRDQHDHNKRKGRDRHRWQEL